MQAMILAAGFGTRLLPHSLLRPKPLFPVLNTPLLLLTIRRLQNVGCDHIVVNCHHLRGQVAAALADLPGVIVLEEEILLGTGGGLRGALAHLRDEPLLVSNGDIYHTIDFADLYRSHQESGARVSLAVHDYPRFNTVQIEGRRIVGFTHTQAGDCLAFTGLHVLDPEILQDIRPGTFSCILDLYKSMLGAGQTIAALRVDGSYWTDMGTSEDYLQLHAGLLKGSIPCWAEIGEWGKTPFIRPVGTRVAADLELTDWACLGAVEVGDDVHLTRVVAWDGVRIEAGSRISDMLLSALWR